MGSDELAMVLLGIISIAIGVTILFVTTFSRLFFLMIYALGFIGVGIALILLRKEEGKIEQRKDLKQTKAKR